MPTRRKSTDAKDSSANLGFEAKLWLAIDKLRNNMDAAEDKHDGKRRAVSDLEVALAA